MASLTRAGYHGVATLTKAARSLPACKLTMTVSILQAAKGAALCCTGAIREHGSLSPAKRCWGVRPTCAAMAAAFSRSAMTSVCPRALASSNAVSPTYRGGGAKVEAAAAEGEGRGCWRHGEAAAAGAQAPSPQTHPTPTSP